MSTEQDILKTLLLKEELELLEQLKEKVLSQEQFALEVSKVLGVAITRAQKEDASFERALSEPIEKGVSRAFTQNKQTIIDGLLPIMGQLIRKTVANSIKQFVTDINRALELGFSTKAIKWRWQAFKTGKSFAEIVFQKTIRYKVMELFLISRENGLLIEHVGSDGSLKDNDAISAMLTVIQDFIRDSFNEEDANLENVTIKNVEYIFASGPKAYIASVVKGSPTERLKEKTQKIIENVHAEFSDSLIKEKNYRNNPKLYNYLSTHLVTKNISDEPKKINWIPWILGTIFLIVGVSYLAYTRSQQFNRVKTLANSIDGLYVASIKRTNDGFMVSGLQDSLADVSQFENENIQLNTKPYLSLDAEIITKRLEKIIQAYPRVDAYLINKTLRLTGSIQTKDQEALFQSINALAGIHHIKNDLIINQDNEIKIFIKQNIPKNLIFELNQTIITLNGKSNFKALKSFINKTKNTFPKLTINQSHVEVLDSTKNLIQYINELSINIPQLDNGNLKENNKLKKVIKSSQLLHQRDSKIQITVIGKSDCNGSKSDGYSLGRALKIKQIFLNNGFDNSVITTSTKQCLKYGVQSNSSKLNVGFKIAH